MLKLLNLLRLQIYHCMLLLFCIVSFNKGCVPSQSMVIYVVDVGVNKCDNYGRILERDIL